MLESSIKMDLTLDQKLKLPRSLKMLGAGELSTLVGHNKLKSINSLLNKELTETNMVNILIARYGSQILAQKTVREAILHNSLSDIHLGFLNSGEVNLKAGPLSSNKLQKLLFSRWGRHSEFTARFLSIFDLGSEYLPPDRPSIISEETIIPVAPLYDFQKRVKDQLLRSLYGDKQRVLIHMPTGAGKTRTAIEGIVDYWRTYGDKKGYMVWLTDSEELSGQAEESFKKVWGIRGDSSIKIYKLWGDHSLPIITEEGGVIIASLQRLHRMSLSPKNKDFSTLIKIKNRNRLIVVDEAHKSVAPTYMQTIEFICNLENTKLIGLTATPGRTKELEIQKLVGFYHNNKIAITNESNQEIENPILYLQKNDYLSHVKRRTVKTKIDIELTLKEQEAVSNLLDIPMSVLIKLSKSNQRNASILFEIIALAEEGKQIIVFACSVEHANLLSELLILRNIKSHCIDSNTESFDRSNFIEEFKKETVKVLVNYGVLTTGFDAPNTNAVVITRPTTSLVLYSQMIGRGIRGPKMGGTKDCVIVDIEDNLINLPSEQTAFNYFNSHWEITNA